jgi:hypothetical protein
LEIKGRATDHLEDFARCRLLLQAFGYLRMRLRQRLRPCLQLFEETDVLDGNHCLVGEGLEELDLAVRERLNLHPADRDSADGDALAQEGRREHGPDPRQALAILELLEVALYSRGKVFDMDRLAIRNGATEDRTSRDRHSFPDPPCGGRGPVVRDELEGVPVHAEDKRIVGTANPGRILRDGIHDRLKLGRRARDDPEDLAGRRLLLKRLGQVAIACL